MGVFLCYGIIFLACTYNTRNRLGGVDIMRWDNQFRVLLVLLVGICIFNFVDYYLTNILLGLGYRELNPVMNVLVGTKYFPIYKLLIIPSLLTVLWVYRITIIKRFMFGVWITFLAYLSLMLYFRILFI